MFNKRYDEYKANHEVIDEAVLKRALSEGKQVKLNRPLAEPALQHYTYSDDSDDSDDDNENSDNAPASWWLHGMLAAPRAVIV